MKAERISTVATVDSAVFRVESGGKIFWVVEERTGGDDYRFTCSCPLKHQCDHVRAVMSHMERSARRGGEGAEGGTPSPSGPSDSRPSLPPTTGRLTRPPRLSGSQAAWGEASLFDQPERTRRVADGLRACLDRLLVENVAGNREGMKDISDEIVRVVEGIQATDLLKSTAALRRAILEDTPDPVAVSIGFERVTGAIQILQSHVNKLPLDERLQTTYLGRTWDTGELDLVEDLHLMEIARNSVLTPFNVRRNESYYMNPFTGDLFVEERYQKPGGGNPSVGPFPKSLHVNLMTVEPRLQPPSLNLLQYSVRPSPGEGDLARIKTMALSTVESALGIYSHIVEVVRSPYPVFVTFQPLRTQMVDDRLIMWDTEGDALGLAYASSPYGCLSVEAVCANNHLHAMAGLLVREGKCLAINPLALLVENGGGLRLERIK
jgi:hypothetical protein